MLLSFVKTSPAQNITVLVDTPVPREEQPAVAAKLLNLLGGEQVGFIEPPAFSDAPARLQMMGGEFCGNATMSVGVYLARKAKIREDEQRIYDLEVSGSDEPVRCSAKKQGESWLGNVRMPLPTRVGSLQMPSGISVPRVDFPGITHLIVPADAARLPRSEAEKEIRALCRELGTPALGIIRYEEEKRFIEPLVYVAATDTAVWERGCGSGTAAVGCWKAAEKNTGYRLSLSQPGGVIEVCAEAQNSRITRLTVSTEITVLQTGTVEL